MSFSTTVQLTNEHVWMEVYPNLEMIARESKMFSPELAFIVGGLEETNNYVIELSMERYDKIRYAFSKGGWSESTARKACAPEPVIFLRHKSGVQSGHKWMQQPVSFDYMKLTNKPIKPEECAGDTFFVQTMHKYLPVVTVTNCTTNESMRFPIEAVQFIPVTDYLNKKVGAWKTWHNKFSTAKNGGRGKRKAARTQQVEPAAKRVPITSNTMTVNHQVLNVPPTNYQITNLSPPTNYSSENVPPTYFEQPYHPHHPGQYPMYPINWYHQYHTPDHSLVTSSDNSTYSTPSPQTFYSHDYNCSMQYYYPQ